MKAKLITCLILLSAISTAAKGQTKILIGTTTPTFTTPQSQLFSSNQILPEYARENPLQYSYLCRLELKLEEKLAIPMWFELGDAPNVSMPIRQNAKVQVKLLRF